MEIKFLLAAFSGVAVLNALFFGVAILANGKGLQKNYLLAFLLFSLGVRTGKSIILLLFPGAPDSLPAIGLVGMALIGPLLFLYIQNVGKAVRLSFRQLPHFFLSGAIALYLPFAAQGAIFWLYFITVVQLGVYLLLLTSSFTANVFEFKNGTKTWVGMLLGAVGVNWVVYLVQLFFQGAMVYLLATLTASVVLFVLAFYGFRNNKVFGRSKNSVRTIDNETLSHEIVSLMETEKLYRESDLSIAKLANILKVKPYLVSAVLNEYHKQSFPEFVNEYRIREAKALLTSPSHQQYSIEAIAYDCGFNTPSAFYTHFKKLTKLTPSAYRSDAAVSV